MTLLLIELLTDNSTFRAAIIPKILSCSTTFYYSTTLLMKMQSYYDYLKSWLQTDEPTDRQTDRLTDRPTDRQTLLSIELLSQRKISMHYTIQQVNYCTKTIITCSYRLTYITICRATITAKPTDITTYSATITAKQLSCIITIYYNTYLLLKLH